METGSVVIRRGGKEKRYDIYIEDYVLSYLKRETDSLELSEIFFYGFQKEMGKKIFVYGAGRGRNISAFDEYELLEELMCRLTQAGPVFMVREKDGTYEVKGFKVFYTNNEAMQRYLLQWREESSEAEEASEKTSEPQQKALLPRKEDMSKKTPHGVMTLQLGLVLIVLVAIVISSTNSYGRMEQLNQSAKEVFFAIENQEAEEGNGDFDQEMQQGTEIAVQRDAATVRKEEDSGGEDTFSETELMKNEENVLESNEDKAAENEADEKEEPGKTEESTQANVEQSDEDNTEALSRSVTRYYEVEQGDTLYTISQKIYGDTSRVEKICEMNEIADPDRIRSGQKIILP